MPYFWFFAAFFAVIMAGGVLAVGLIGATVAIVSCLVVLIFLFLRRVSQAMARIRRDPNDPKHPDFKGGSGEPVSSP